MFGVTDYLGLDFLHREDKVVLVLLSTKMRPSTIDWMCRSWNEIHHRSAYDWHLVVPTNKPINGDDGELHPENFSSELSNQLMNTYGLSTNDIPCLVLDNFQEDVRQRYIPLPEKETDRAKLVFEIETFVKSRPRASRQILIDGLYNHFQTRSWLKNLIRMAPIAGSVVKNVSRGF